MDTNAEDLYKDTRCKDITIDIVQRTLSEQIEA